MPVVAPHDGASVLACAYQLKVRSQNPKDFEHWFSQRLWVKFTMFLLNSTSVDAGAIIGTCHGTSVGRLRHRDRHSSVRLLSTIFQKTTKIKAN